jgi:hypothetical protein
MVAGANQCWKLGVQESEDSEIDVIVLIFCLVRVAGIYEQLLPFPYLHMIHLISAYAIIPWIAQHLLVIDHMFV